MSEPAVWRLETGCNSDVGVQRDLYEDSVLVLGPSALPSELDVVLAADDGIGGHRAGEITSQVVVHQLDRWLVSGDYGRQVAYSPNHDDCFVVVLKELLETLNDQVFRMAANDSGKSGMGTTTTGAAVRGPNLFAGHLGTAGPTCCVPVSSISSRKTTPGWRSKYRGRGDEPGRGSSSQAPTRSHPGNGSGTAGARGKANGRPAG